jgi:superfamily II DNA or RNA helicase
MTISLRPWQDEAIKKALIWLTTSQDRHFLINAAPGSGKTIAACELANRLIAMGEIDSVIVIAPRREIVKQWATDFKVVTGRYMSKISGVTELEDFGKDVCATWAAVQGLQNAFSELCNSKKTLVICDEHHHAAVEAAWGDSANSAFANAKYVLILTGTPIRSDGNESIWLAYDDKGKISHPTDGTYTLTYGEAVDLLYCRPVSFHRHEGRFSVSIDDQSVHVSSQRPAEITGGLSRIGALQKMLSFYRLACTPQFEATDPEMPLRGGYQWTMVEAGSEKLDDIRNRMPEAGGLVIAPNIEMAEYFVKVIEAVEGERPVIVHSEKSDSDERIAAFKNSTRRWIVSVAMISEGVDIPRLRILLYLPNSQTELSFRQAIGRVVRTNGYNDDTRAYVVMPSWEIFDQYARRIEREMSASKRGGGEDKPKYKKCPSCSTELDLSATNCNVCGHEFPPVTRQLKECPQCQAKNRLSASECHVCHYSYLQEYKLTLEEALRMGAIVRGLDLTEEEVREAEEMMPELRATILKSGDENLIKLLQRIPDESFARLTQILSQLKK